MSQNTKTFSKPDHLSFTLEQFSNDQIDAILERSNNWRNMQDDQVQKYLYAMRVGKWEPGNGECLAFDAAGRVVNGQHRLSAARIVQEETGRLIWFWVARNVTKESIESMDQGRNRKVLEFLRRDGVPLASEVSAIASSIARRAMVREDATLASMVASKVKPSNGQVLDAYRQNSHAIQRWASASQKLTDHGFPRAGLLCSLFYQFAKQDERRAWLFFEKLIDGSELKSNDPVFLLRNMLLAEKSAKQKRDRQDLGAIIIKAWVAWNEGRSMTLLKWNAVGPSAEGFPDHRFRAV